MDYVITYSKIKVLQWHLPAVASKNFIFGTLFARPLSSGETDRLHREMSHFFQRCHISILSTAVLCGMGEGESSAHM